MKNKDTKKDYQKVVRVGDQKSEIAETTFGTIFCLRFIFTIFLYKEFSSPTWKISPPPKMPIPTQITIWHKSFLYTRFEKWLNLAHVWESQKIDKHQR